MIQGRWKLLILRELEADGVVVRTVHAQVPPRVDHALSHLGQELMPVLESLHAFGEQVGRDR
jgi:DNA-binding HxlR family transcriptional regulator